MERWEEGMVRRNLKEMRGGETDDLNNYGWESECQYLILQSDLSSNMLGEIGVYTCVLYVAVSV